MPAKEAFPSVKALLKCCPKGGATMHSIRSRPFCPVLKFLRFGVPNRAAELAHSSRVVLVAPGSHWGRSCPRYEGFRVQRVLHECLSVQGRGVDLTLRISPRQRISATSGRADTADSLLLGLAHLPCSREQYAPG